MQLLWNRITGMILANVLSPAIFLAGALSSSGALGSAVLDTPVQSPPVPAAGGTTSDTADSAESSAPPPQPAASDEPPVPGASDGPPMPDDPTTSSSSDEESADDSLEPAPDSSNAQAEPQAEEESNPSDGRHDRAGSSRSRGFYATLVRWLGKFHPATVHFPIALLWAAALAELSWAVSEQQRFRFAARFCLLLGALGASGTAILGWFLAGFQITDATWVHTLHRWLGTGTALWAVLTFGLSELSQLRNEVKWERSFWATLFLGPLLVLMTGFFGGGIVRGLNHYQWPRSQSDTGKKVAEATEVEAAVTVEMNDEFVFDPEKVTVNAGETVTWRGVGNYPHTVTADPDKANDADHVRLPEGATAFDSGRIQPGETFSYIFDVPGMYRYFCIPHESAGMIGEVEVKANSGTEKQD